MSNIPKSSSITMKRRRFLEGLSLMAMSQIAGCGEANGDDNRGSTADRLSTQSRHSGMPRGVRTEIEELETVFEALSDLPIRRSGTFAFDVKEFENEFDHRTLVEMCDSITADLRSTEIQEHDGSSISVLHTVTEIAKQLVQQRIVLHQVIAAGLEFRKEFYRINLEKAAEVMSDARLSVTQLQRLGVGLEETLEMVDGRPTPIDGFDRDAIERPKVAPRYYPVDRLLVRGALLRIERRRVVR